MAKRKDPGAVRITGGALRGRTLKVPRGARPSSSRLREALFSIWADRLPQARLLDLFAGSGAVALEAASRGALTVVCVEAHQASLAVLTSNVDRLGQRGIVQLRRAHLPAGLANLAQEAAPFDLVFADPPYAFCDHAALLAAVAPLLVGDGELALEHSSRLSPPAVTGGLIQVDRRRYGESALTFYRRDPGARRVTGEG